MDRLDRLLVIVEPADTAANVLARAMQIARHFASRIDLMLCAQRNAADAGTRFLKGLVSSVAAGNVRIEPHVLTGPSTADIVAARLREVPADLVIKHPTGREALRRRMWSSNDWQLVDDCPCHVLLTRARPWHPVPRFAGGPRRSSGRTPVGSGRARGAEVSGAPSRRADGSAPRRDAGVIRCVGPETRWVA